jgi:CheY-like chemotaxis protein
LNITLPNTPLRVVGDPTRLVQILSNLLNNAAKYTDEGGQLWLETAQEDGQAVIRVRDNGLGLAPELLPHVFDLFTQAEHSLDRSQGGLGIGLTLVRNLVDLHGGKIEARSAGLGQGSEFIVRLPLAGVVEAGTAARERTIAPPTRALRILVVEDNTDSAEVLAFMLELSGHTVQTAADGPTALAAAHAFQPQVVLCDIGLPGMSGYEVAARLREQAAFQQTVLIALTGYGQEDDRWQAEAAGFNQHLTKPVEPELLEALLNSL